MDISSRTLLLTALSYHLRTGSRFRAAFGRARGKGPTYKGCLEERESCIRTRSHTSSQPTSASMEIIPVESFSSRARAWMPVVSFCAVVLLYTFRRRRHALPYPPGPKGLPIIGNALDIPSKNPCLTYWQWGKKYGMYFPY